MQRRILLLLALVVVPAIVSANELSFGPSGSGGSATVAILAADLPGQQISLVLSGTDFYTDSNLRIVINGGVGPAPKITAVFNDPGLAIPGANLAGSIWANGSGGIFSPPNGTAADSSGLETVAFYVTAGASPQNLIGLHTLLTISTVGVPGGYYSFDITSSDMFNGLDDEFNPIPVPLTIHAMTLVVPGVPEPSSIVLGLFAAGALGVMVIGRRQTA